MYLATYFSCLFESAMFRSSSIFKCCKHLCRQSKLKSVIFILHQSFDSFFPIESLYESLVQIEIKTTLQFDFEQNIQQTKKKTEFSQVIFFRNFSVL